MMYNNKMVVVVKSNGKILREQNGIVYLPFGSEYELSFKNLHTTKAVVDVHVDGKDVLNGVQLIVNPNDETSLEGFLKNNKVSHRFKFIEKTQEISDYRGNRLEDGLIRVNFKFERETIPFPTIHRKCFYNDNEPYKPLYSSEPSFCCDVANQPLMANCCLNNGSNVNDSGITVHGSESDQSFTNGSVGSLELKEHSIIIHLKGIANNDCIQKPIYVQTRLQCSSCGRKWKSNNKFCGNCGTALV